MSEKLGCPPSYHDNFATTADILSSAMTGGDDEVLVASIRDAFKFLAPGCDVTLVRFRDVLAELARQRAIGQNHPLYRQWEKICTDFQATLWESHKCASKMSARMKSFYKVLGPIVIESALPTDMKLGTVKNFVKACEDNEEQGVALVEKFENIFTQVNNFEKALQGFLYDRHAEIVEHEKGTREVISQLNGEITGLWLKVGVVSVGIAAAVAAFGALVAYKPASLTILNRTISIPTTSRIQPAASFIAGLQANSALNAFGDLMEKRRDRTALTARLNGLRAEKFSVEITTEKFANLQNSRLSEIKHNIECFTNAWQRLIGGCVQLQESLEIAKDHVEYPQAFAHSLAGTCELYKAMTECLDTYATGVLTASRFRCR